MDRLTDEEIKGMAEFCGAKNCVNYERNWCCGYERYQRLAAYEDTGLTPEEIKTLGEKLKRSAVAIIEDSKHQERMLKMLEMERAEAEGRLIAFPCKVWDTVWVTLHPFKFEKLQKALAGTVVRVSRGVLGDSISVSFDTRKINGCREFLCSFIGKTVFLTREEAERALEGEQKE